MVAQAVHLELLKYSQEKSKAAFIGNYILRFMGIRLVVYILMFLFIASSCTEPAATSAFASLEGDFEQAATDLQTQAKDEVERNFILSPKFPREHMQPDYERAQIVQHCADTLSAYINRLKDTLSLTGKGSDRESNGTLKNQVLHTGGYL